MRFGPTLDNALNTTSIYIDGEMRWHTEDGVLIIAVPSDFQSVQKKFLGFAVGPVPESVFDLRIGLHQVYWRLTEKEVEKKLFELGYRERVSTKNIEIITLPAKKCPINHFSVNGFDFEGPVFTAIPDAVMPETELDQSGADFSVFMEELEKASA